MDDRPSFYPDPELERIFRRVQAAPPSTPPPRRPRPPVRRGNNHRFWFFALAGVGVIIFLCIAVSIGQAIFASLAHPQQNYSPPTESSSTTNGNSSSSSQNNPTPTPTEIPHSGTTLAIPSDEHFTAEFTTDYQISYRDGAYSSSNCDAQANDWTTALSISGGGSSWTLFDLGYSPSWDAATAKAKANSQPLSIHLNAGDTITLTPAGNAQCFSGYGAETVDIHW